MNASTMYQAAPYLLPLAVALLANGIRVGYASMKEKR